MRGRKILRPDYRPGKKLESEKKIQERVHRWTIYHMWKRQLSLTELSVGAGLGMHTVTGICRTRASNRDAGLESICVLSDFFGIDPADLMAPNPPDVNKYRRILKKNFILQKRGTYIQMNAVEVRRRVQETGMDHKKAHKLTGISPASFRRSMKMEWNKLHVSTAERMARCLGCSVEDITIPWEEPNVDDD